MSKAQILVVLSDILKSELTYKSRIAIPAPKGTKMGDLVKYDVRNQYLVALSDEEHGKVMVQPHNCVINLDNIELPAKVDGQPFNAQEWIKQGDAFGIQYIGKIHQSEVVELASVAVDGVISEPSVLETGSHRNSFGD